MCSKATERLKAMEYKTEKLVNAILESYGSYDLTNRIDEENIPNKNIIIEVVEKIRRLLFPGYFDNSKARSEYIKFLVGEQLEFIEYNLKNRLQRHSEAVRTVGIVPDLHLQKNQKIFHFIL